MSRDVDTLWQPSASLEALHLRAAMLASIRKFFSLKQVLEVETPVLSHAGTTDPHIESFVTQYQHGAESRSLYLNTSPEFHMKRLLASGSGPIYQISRVFRDKEQGPYHNAEFTLLEWYQLDYDCHRLMAEVYELLEYVLNSVTVRDRITLSAAEHVRYQDLFQMYLSIDPMAADEASLIECVTRNGIEVVGMEAADRETLLDLLMSHCIQPRLRAEADNPMIRVVFIYDYPASQASLAKIRNDDPPVAERFELLLNGVEIANGFSELQDPEEQLKRFEQDNRKRQLHRQSEIKIDRHLIQALKAGLPDCSGVALGLDRLIQTAIGTKSLHSCLAFPLDRA